MKQVTRRGPRQILPGRTCKNCQKIYTAFRKTSIFCCKSCKIRFHQKQKPRVTPQTKALKVWDRVCMECGKDTEYVFVWYPLGRAIEGSNAVVLCGRHHVQMSGSVQAEQRRAQYLKA